MQPCLKGKQTISQLARGKDSFVPAARDQTVVHFAGVGEVGVLGKELKVQLSRGAAVRTDSSVCPNSHHKCKKDSC